MADAGSPPDLLDVATTRLSVFLRGLHRDTWVALAVLAVALLLRLNGLATPVDNPAEGTLVMTLRLLAHGVPLYRQVPSSQPPLFLLSLFPWFALGGQSLFAARLAIVVASGLGLGAAWWIGRLLGGPRVALVTLTLLAFDPVFLAASRSVNAEVPALALALLSVALALGTNRLPLLTTRQVQALRILAGAALAAGILTSGAMIPAIIPVFWILLAPLWGTVVAPLWRQRRWPDDTERQTLSSLARQPLQQCLIGAGAVTVLTLLPFAGALPALWSQVVAPPSVAVGGLGISRNGNLGVLLGAWWELPVIALGLMAGISQIARGLALMADNTVEPAAPPSAGSASFTAASFTAWGVVTLVTLLFQEPLIPHQLAMLTPPLALAAGCASPDLIWFPRLSARWHASSTLSGLLVSVVVLVGIVTVVVQQTDQRNHPPTALEGTAYYLGVLTLPGDVVVTDDPMAAVLADRDVPPSVADTSLARIATGQVTTATVTTAASDPHVTAILWLSGNFDHLPGLHNWVVAHFVRVSDYGGNRGIYVRGAPSLPVGGVGWPLPPGSYERG